MMQSDSCHNSLIIRRVARMGGGKIHLRFASQRHIFASLITFHFFLFILAGCKPAGYTLCGIPNVSNGKLNGTWYMVNGKWL